MSDGIDYTVITKPFTDFLDDRQLRMRRAAMFTVRQAGRVVRTAARAKAPVLKDKSVQSIHQRRKSGSTAKGPIRGLLKDSIKPSRRLQFSGETWSLKVGPRGPRVHLYANKEEEAAHYMAAGYDAVVAAMPIIAQLAYDKVWRE